MIQVLIAGSTRIYREGLSRALSDQESLNVCATVATAAEAERVIREVRLDVLLVDTMMESALDIVGLAASLDAGIKIVALAVADDEKEIIAWAESGISGFITRDNSLDDLVGSIVAASKGELACSPRHAAALLNQVAKLSALRPRASPPQPSVLTRRQMHVLELVSSGLSNKEIARKLGIEVTTVKNHVHHLLGKLNIKRRADVPHVAWQPQGRSVTLPDRYTA